MTNTAQSGTIAAQDFNFNDNITFIYHVKTGKVMLKNDTQETKL